MLLCKSQGVVSFHNKIFTINLTKIKLPFIVSDAWLKLITQIDKGLVCDELTD